MIKENQMSHGCQYLVWDNKILFRKSLQKIVNISGWQHHKPIKEIFIILETVSITQLQHFFMIEASAELAQSGPVV